MEHCEPGDAGITPETGAGSSRIAGSSDHEQKATHYLPFVASSSSPKRRRRSVEKRVVTLPLAEADAKRSKGAGEGPPPSDTWAWRKYGQKPIKGSPYPRGYYRCSSSKGCPARKQVERSQMDPTMLVITYTCEHNHYSAQPNNNYRLGPASSSKSNPVLDRSDHFIPPNTTKPDDKLLDPIIAEETPCNDYYWFSDVGSPCTGSTDELLLGSIVGWGDMDAMMSFTSECVELSDVGGWEEEDLLFAGLGELPECRVVFQRGFLERQMVAVQGEG